VSVSVCVCVYMCVCAYMWGGVWIGEEKGKVVWVDRDILNYKKKKGKKGRTEEE
jgi:hypothetical protein